MQNELLKPALGSTTCCAIGPRNKWCALRPSQRQKMAMVAVAVAAAQSGAGIALVHPTFQIRETCYRYCSLLSDENEEIAE